MNLRDRIAKLEAQDDSADTEYAEWARQRNAAKVAAFDPEALYEELQKVADEVGPERFARQTARYLEGRHEP